MLNPYWLMLLSISYFWGDHGLQTERFEFLIDAIYAAGAEPKHWPVALKKLADSFSAVGATLTVKHAGEMQFSIRANFGVAPVCLDSYAAEHSVTASGTCAAVSSGGTPRSCARCGQRVDIGGTANVILAKTECQIACCNLINTTAATGFSECEAKALNKLAPHILRAIELNQRLARAQTEQQALSDALNRLAIGVFMLQADGRLACVNAAGERLLSQHNGLERNGSRIYITEPSVNRELSSIVQQVAITGRSAFVAVPRREGLRPLMLRVCRSNQLADAGRDEARIVMFATDPEVSPLGAADCMMVAYGLTTAEKKLVDALAAGESLKEAADALGVTEVTLRNRLARVMAKTGTNRQAELMAVVMAGYIPAH